jgi:flagellar biosynthesis chaperone FliJ
MKRFVWRLQHVLEIKTKQEQIKRAELLNLTEKLAQMRGKLITEQTKLKDIISNISRIKPRKRLNEQEFFLKYSAISDEQIKKLKNEISVLELQQRDKLAEVIRLRRFKEGLEKLQTNAKKEFIKEQEKLEQKESDEGTTIRFARLFLPVTRDSSLESWGTGHELRF